MTLKSLLSTAALMALPHMALADAPKAFDVAEDITRFVFAAAPVFDDGLPAYGNAFVTQGYIYPAGTLSNGAEGVNPVVADVAEQQALLDGVPRRALDEREARRNLLDRTRDRADLGLERGGKQDGSGDSVQGE